jgi:hypothetical protein
VKERCWQEGKDWGEILLELKTSTSDLLRFQLHNTIRRRREREREREGERERASQAEREVSICLSRYKAPKTDRKNISYDSAYTAVSSQLLPYILLIRNGYQLVIQLKSIATNVLILKWTK